MKSTATLEQIHTIIQQARQAWLDGDGNAFAELFSTTGTFIVPGQQWQGFDEILTAFQDFISTSNVTAIEIRNVVVQGDRAMVEWYWQEEKQNGQISSADDAIAIDFVGDRIQRWREYIDTDSTST